DQFGRSITYLRLSITPRCNLNCIYCRPGHCPAGYDPFAQTRILTVAEIDRLVRVLARLGIQKIRLTGGEPLLRPDLEEIIRQIRCHPEITDLSLTTNGQDLAERAAALKDAGLMRVNISLDSLRADRFEKITGNGSLERALAGIDASLAVGLHPVKLNTVLMRGVNDDELDQLFDLTFDRPLALRLIELMPMNQAAAASEHLVTGTEILQRYPQLERVADSYPGQPAEDYRLPGHIGTIGLIRPISHKFCHICNRVRITADGKVKGCLGQDDEYDLLPWLDQPDDALLVQALAAAILAKPPSHQFEARQVPGRGMDRTGG
ncbi:MAG: GTP 3',8-cyclase MoaA, partial [Clostridia bacterium]|nr:GTP 3',8-cyclase MoaA [Clostridia bacterium]